MEDEVSKTKTPPSVSVAKLETASTSDTPAGDTKEILLCLRPIRDGDPQRHEELIIDGKAARSKRVVGEVISGTSGEGASDEPTSSGESPSRPPKKRRPTDALEPEAMHLEVGPGDAMAATSV